MQKILVPVDFSATSRNAAVYAAELARLFNAQLILLHAYMLPTPISEMPYAMVTADETQHDYEKQLHAIAAQLNQTYGVFVEKLVRIGAASDEIKELAKENAVDLIVMGMKGVGGLDKLIGSTTTNVIRKANIPVLIIPHEAGYRPVQHITYASDFSYQTSSRLFNPLLQVLEKTGARLHIVHIYKEAIKEEAAPSRLDIERLFGGYQPEFESVISNSVTEGISNYVKTHSSEWLVMVAHTHTFLERIFSKSRTVAMAYDTNIPLLVLQDKE